MSSEVREGLHRRLVANSRLMVGTRVVTAVLSLATIPVIVAHLGVAGYGAWEALFALATLSSGIQGAVNGMLVWRMSAAFGAGDPAEIRRLSGMGATLGYVIVGVGWPLAWLLTGPVLRVIRLPAELAGPAHLAFPVMVGLVLLGGLCDTVEATLSGNQRSGLVSVVAAAGLAANYITAIIAVSAGAGLAGLVGGLAVGWVARLVTGLAVARSVRSGATLVPGAVTAADLAASRYSGLMLVGFLAQVLRDQTDKVVLAVFASPTWVGVYGIAARAASLLFEVSRFFYIPMLTAVGALHAHGDWDGVGLLYRRMMDAVSTVTGAVLLGTAGLASPLLVLWLGRPMPEVPPLLWVLISGTTAAVMLTGPGTALCRGIGRVEIETRYLAFNLLCNLALTALLVATVGARGTVIATGISWVAGAVYFLVVLHHAVRLPVVATWRTVQRAVLSALLAVGLGLLVRLQSEAVTRPAALVQVVEFGLLGLGGYLGALRLLGLLPRWRSTTMPAAA